MLYTPINRWWCCQNPRERNMTVFLIGAYVANDEYVTLAQYTVFSFLTGMAALSLLSASYVERYGLEYGSIIDGEGNPTAVYFFDAEQWAEFYVFSLTDAFICTSPCQLLTFPL